MLLFWNINITMNDFNFKNKNNKFNNIYNMINISCIFNHNRYAES